MTRPPLVVAVGEAVWDIFPDRQVLGGAPLNVACHLARLGLDCRFVSAVGTDPLGDETVQAMARLGLDTSFVQRHPQLATGRVLVHFDEASRDHSFEILRPAAWDEIDAGAALAAAADLGERELVVVFGTLAQRAFASRAAVRGLLEIAQRGVYDVNLRPPDTTMALVAESLEAAQLVKMNEEELRLIGGELLGLRTAAEGDPMELAEQVRDRFGLHLLAVTAGSRGAFLASSRGLAFHPGFPTRVADTVGAGDAFLAGLIEGVVRGRSLPDTLIRANRLGSFVASRPGAVPEGIAKFRDP